MNTREIGSLSLIDRLLYVAAGKHSLGHDVLEPVPVLVLEHRHDGLPPLPPAPLQLEQRRRRGVPPLQKKEKDSFQLLG